MLELTTGWEDTAGSCTVCCDGIEWSLTLPSSFFDCEGGEFGEVGDCEGGELGGGGDCGGCLGRGGVGRGLRGLVLGASRGFRGRVAVKRTDEEKSEAGRGSEACRR